MFGMLIAYDDDGNVVATRDYQVVYDPDTLNPLGIADYLSHEEAGGENTAWWRVENHDTTPDGTLILSPVQVVKGSKVWPEWLGGQAHHFRVILAGSPSDKRIVTLIHKSSGHRRERAAIEAEIEKRVTQARAKGEAADLRDLLGGPNRPLLLDAEGKTRPRPARSQRPNLPVVRRQKPEPETE